MILAFQGNTHAVLREEYCAYVPADISGIFSIAKMIKEASKEIYGIFTLVMRSILLD